MNLASSRSMLSVAAMAASLTFGSGCGAASPAGRPPSQSAAPCQLCSRTGSSADCVPSSAMSSDRKILHHHRPAGRRAAGRHRRRARWPRGARSPCRSATTSNAASCWLCWTTVRCVPPAIRRKPAWPRCTRRSREWEAEQKSARGRSAPRRYHARRQDPQRGRLGARKYKLDETVAEVARYRADETAAEADLEVANLQLEQSRIVAPFAGVVGRSSVRLAQEVKEGRRSLLDHRRWRRCTFSSPSRSPRWPPSPAARRLS